MAHTPRSPSDPQRMLALAVDDDPSFLEGLRMMLRLCGFADVETAGDAESAWEVLQERPRQLRPVQMVVCDWNMDPTNGLHLLRRVRADRTIARTPFILVTASLSEEAWRGAITCGATDFLNKPFSLETLRESIDLALSLPAPEPLMAPDNLVPFPRSRMQRAARRKQG
ncbi:MAG: chemotaxis regulator - transmits chemoreceptor signals to flagelllar motor component CheY [Hyphomicrobiales bacterium]|nr:chemotaxis regulator - transmits chemoreceptor signals to flagelllar motor component CheY [Hyphomicrobiales bacterium]